MVMFIYRYSIHMYDTTSSLVFQHISINTKFKVEPCFGHMDSQDSGEKMEEERTQVCGFVS